MTILAVFKEVFVNYLLVRHKVTDFDVWKEVFDSHAKAQKESGMKAEKVLRNIEDPDEVFLLLEVSDMETVMQSLSLSTDLIGRTGGGPVQPGLHNEGYDPQSYDGAEHQQ